MVRRFWVQGIWGAGILKLFLLLFRLCLTERFDQKGLGWTLKVMGFWFVCGLLSFGLD